LLFFRNFYFFVSLISFNRFVGLSEVGMNLDGFRRELKMFLDLFEYD